MAYRRRASDSSVGGMLASPASSYDRSPPVRQTSVRLARRSSSGTQARVSARSNSNLAQTASTNRSARTRRPTPIVRRRTTTLVQSSRDNVLSNDNSTEDTNNNSEQSEIGRLDVTSSSRRARTNNGTGERRDRTLTITTGRRSSDPNQLNWYERLMPECILTMTAPITGYESRLDEDVDEQEYEILERQRLRRNRRVRRRLLTLVLVAAAASAFMYSQGRFFRKAGVKATMSGLKHRLEDGLAKSIHDTMGK